MGIKHNSEFYADFETVYYTILIHTGMEEGELNQREG